MPLSSQLAGARILVTGASGFLGQVWLAQLLEDVPQLGCAWVLLRPARPREPARERFARLVDTSPVFRRLRALHGAELGGWLAARVRVLDGDVERPWLGLGPDVLASLSGHVDVAVHCAGLTDFQPDPLRAMAVNVGGAKHAADVAAAVGAHLVHVSTAFVAGVADGAVPESIEPGVSPNGTRFSVSTELRALQLTCRSGAAAAEGPARVEAGMQRATALGWPNLYTYSKGLAEHLLAGRPGLEHTIVRPSIVECARTRPFPGWNQGLNTAGPLAWYISTAATRFPARAGNTLDAVPVDDVARGLTLTVAAILRGEGGGVVQLASGDSNPLSFGRAVELTGLGYRRWVRLGGGTPADRWLRHLDSWPSAERQGWLGVRRLHAFAREAHALASGFERDQLPAPIQDVAGSLLERASARVEAPLRSGHRKLGRLTAMLDLFKPFIHDHDYTFCTERVRAWSDALAPEDAEHRWGVPELDWRHYWVEVEYPGLQQWSIPILRGDRIPSDPPSVPPLQLVEPELVRAAGK